MKNVLEYLTERASLSKKADYEEGTFGFWWTVVERQEDIQGKHYEGYIDCSNNNLTSLEGAPSTVGGGFYCQNNDLTSLEGAPSTVGNFYCSNNNLTSLEGAPSTVGGGFHCSKNTKKFTKEEVKAVSKVKGDIYV